MSMAKKRISPWDPEPNGRRPPMSGISGLRSRPSEECDWPRHSYLLPVGPPPVQSLQPLHWVRWSPLPHSGPRHDPSATCVPEDKLDRERRPLPPSSKHTTPPNGNGASRGPLGECGVSEWEEGLGQVLSTGLYRSGQVSGTVGATGLQLKKPPGSCHWRDPRGLHFSPAKWTKITPSR